MDEPTTILGRPEPPTGRRVTVPGPSDLDDDQRALYERITQGPRRSEQGLVPIADPEGRLLGPFGLMLLAPSIGESVQELGAALRFRGALTPRSRELVILVVAAHAGSHFEWWAHEKAALAAGLDPSQLQRLLDGETPEGLDATERCCVAVAFALRREQGLSDEAYADAKATLGEAGLAEVTWLVGYYAMLALALEVLRP